jgi:hypothetical protein
LQDKATEAVGDLVGVFKGGVVPAPQPRPEERKSNDLYVANVKPAGPQGNELAIALMESKRHEEVAPKATQSQRRRSTGSTAMTRTAAASAPRRNRRSSGFLSLLG